jgi:hypothetical protein
VEEAAISVRVVRAADMEGAAAVHVDVVQAGADGLEVDQRCRGFG